MITCSDDVQCMYSWECTAIQISSTYFQWKSIHHSITFTCGQCVTFLGSESTFGDSTLSSSSPFGERCTILLNRSMCECVHSPTEMRVQFPHIYGHFAYQQYQVKDIHSCATCELLIIYHHWKFLLSNTVRIKCMCLTVHCLGMHKTI